MNLAYNDYLQHHGIKGQKWGVRRYQNPDGSLTNDGKKRYYSSLKSRIDNGLKNNKSYLNDEQLTKDIQSDAKRVLSTDKINKILQLKQTATDKSKSTKEFEDSNEYKEMLKDAHEKTLKDIKSYNPKEYERLIDLHSKGKDIYWESRDYEHVFDGWTDELSNHYRKKFDMTDDGKASKLADKAWDDYFSYTKELSKELLGQYGDEKISNSWLSYSYVVADALRNLNK